MEPGDVRSRLIEAMSEPLRMEVFSLIAERPGVTIKDLARRTAQSPRRVRHRVEWLREAGLVEVEQRTATRNTREAHYRATVFPTLDGALPEEDERKLALAMHRLMFADLGLSFKEGSLGKPGHWAQYRLPGSVDEEALDEIASTLIRAVGEVEKSMKKAARRLRESGAPGVPISTNLGFFEMPPWKASSGGGRSAWEESRRGTEKPD